MKQTQNRSILDHLNEHGSITPGEALLVYGVFRLAARVNELRNKGHKIETQMREDGNGKKYARYWLVSV